MDLPIIRLEIENIRHSIMMALSDYEVKISKEVQDRVKQFLEPENVQRIVAIEVDRTIEACIKEAIRDYFSYSGEGRKIIRKGVEAKLSEMEKRGDLF